MKQSIIQITTGIIITLIGVGALLSTLNVFPFWDYFRDWWPLLISLAGVFVLFGEGNKKYSNLFWGVILIAAGVVLTLNVQDLADYNLFGLIVPIVIIYAGLSLLLSRNSRLKTRQNSSDEDNISAILGGSETVNNSKKYKGGRHTAILGGVSLDLRDAKLADNAQIELFVVLGGVELKVPRDWRVISNITPIAGGVKNKSQGTDEKSPTLVITGTVALGGVEIKT